MEVWRWIAVAAMLYGIIALRAPGMTRHFGPPGGGHPPGPPPSYDFEQPTPPVHLLPDRAEQSADTVPDPDDSSNHVLRWTYRLDRPLIYALGFPVRPPADARRLKLRIRADFEGELRIGVRDRDGSMYSTAVIVSTDWRELDLPLSEMKVARAREDENGQLDVDQIEGIGVIDVHLGAATRKGQQVSVEIDDVRFE